MARTEPIEKDSGFPVNDSSPKINGKTVAENYEVASKEQTDEQAAVCSQRLRDRFWKNCIVISLGFLLLFMGYYPVSAVQSSLNDDQGLGTAALSAKYASMAFGNLFTNNAIVDRLGCKWSLTIGMFLYSSYIGANFYPTWTTLMTFGILSGVGGSAMWMAQGTYLTRLCDQYVLLTAPLSTDHSEELSRVKSKVFGMFNIFYLSSSALGNLASSLILPQDNSNATDDPARLALCGAVYCNEDLDNPPETSESLGNDTGSDDPQEGDDTSSTQPPQSSVYILCTFCFTSALLGGVLLLLFVDHLAKLGVNETKTGKRSVFYLLGATARNWKKPHQLLLIPLGLYNGMDGPFWTAEFTKAYVTCSVGVHYIGYVVMCYGATVPVFIFIFSWFQKDKRIRFIPYLLGLAAQLPVLIILLEWKPTPDQMWVLFVLSVVWAVGSAVWFPMMISFYSIVFREDMEAAFSNFHLFTCLGSSITYAWSWGLCVSTKIYLMMGILCVGVTCYLIVEGHLFYLEFKQKRLGQKTVSLETQAL